MNFGKLQYDSKAAEYVGCYRQLYIFEEDHWIDGKSQAGRGH
jgi:hypothetical protein